MDDLWDEGAEEGTGGVELGREWSIRREKLFNVGYREGLEEGKQILLQQGFDQGFKDGMGAGLEWGAVRGAVLTLQALSKLHPEVLPTSSSREQMKTLAHETDMSPQQALSLLCAHVWDTTTTHFCDRQLAELSPEPQSSQPVGSCPPATDVSIAGATQVIPAGATSSAAHSPSQTCACAAPQRPGDMSAQVNDIPQSTQKEGRGCQSDTDPRHKVEDGGMPGLDSQLDRLDGADGSAKAATSHAEDISAAVHHDSCCTTRDAGVCCRTQSRAAQQSVEAELSALTLHEADAAAAGYHATRSEQFPLVKKAQVILKGLGVTLTTAD